MSPRRRSLCPFFSSRPSSTSPSPFPSPHPSIPSLLHFTHNFAKKLIKIMCLRSPTSSHGLWTVAQEFESAPLLFSIIKVEGLKNHKSRETCTKYTLGAPWPESQRVTTSHNESQRPSNRAAKNCLLRMCQNSRLPKIVLPKCQSCQKLSSGCRRASSHHPPDLP